MKKFVFIAIVAVASLGFIGCGEDNGTTLKWQNDNTGVDLREIKWKQLGAIDADQTWAGINDNTTSDSKGIEVLSGTTEAIDDSTGLTTLLSLDPGTGVISASGQSAVIEENAAATVIISSAK